MPIIGHNHVSQAEFDARYAKHNGNAALQHRKHVESEKTPTKLQMYAEYLPVYHKIKCKHYPVTGPGVGWMKCMTWVITMVILAILYIVRTIVLGG